MSPPTVDPPEHPGASVERAVRRELFDPRRVINRVAGLRAVGRVAVVEVVAAGLQRVRDPKFAGVGVEGDAPAGGELRRVRMETSGRPTVPTEAARKGTPATPTCSGRRAVHRNALRRGPNPHGVGERTRDFRRRRRGHVELEELEVRARTAPIGDPERLRDHSPGFTRYAERVGATSRDARGQIEGEPHGAVEDRGHAVDHGAYCPSRRRSD